MAITGLQALLAYALLPLLLVFVYVSYRTVVVATQGVPMDSWTRGQARPSPPFIVRAQNAQLNILENLPIFAVLVMAAHFTGQAALADGVALPILLARLAQTATHLIGVNHWLVLIRGTFWIVQAALFVYLFVVLF